MNQNLRRKLDRITDILWAGGVTNPVTYIEQISYLIFLKLLDEEESDRELRGAPDGRGSEQRQRAALPEAGRALPLVEMAASRAETICATSFATRSSRTWPRS